MPKFADDVYTAFLQVIEDTHQLWENTAVTTRLILAILMAGLGIYLGSRAERSGMSAVLFFAAFGFFAYVIAVGMTLMR